MHSKALNLKRIIAQALRRLDKTTEPGECEALVRYLVADVNEITKEQTIIKCEYNADTYVMEVHLSNGKIEVFIIDFEIDEDVIHKMYKVIINAWTGLTVQ